MARLCEFENDFGATCPHGDKCEKIHLFVEKSHLIRIHHFIPVAEIVEEKLSKFYLDTYIKMSAFGPVKRLHLAYGLNWRLVYAIYVEVFISNILTLTNFL